MNARALLLLTALAGCGRLVGGRCDDGWTPSPGACDAGSLQDSAIDARADVPTDAGEDVITLDAGDATTADVAFDVAFDAGDARVDASLDATTEDAPGDASPGDARADATTDDARADATADDARADAGRPCTPPERTCDGRCVDFTADPMNCGGCGQPCVAGAFCVGGACSVVCGDGRIRCDGACVDPQSDPLNCGGCGVVCPTGLCNGGVCRDGRVGHLVLIGHDLAATRPDQSRLVGNAAFLASASATRAVIYTEFAEADALRNLEDAVRAVAGPRTATIDRAGDVDALEAALSVDRADAVFIAHQANASPAQVELVARRVSARVVAFTRAGGAFIVLDGGGSSATWSFAERTALLPVSGTRDVTGQPTTLTNGADALAIGVASAWRAERRSAVFTGTLGVGVVVRAQGEPLALHLVVTR